MQTMWLVMEALLKMAGMPIWGRGEEPVVVPIVEVVVLMVFGVGCGRGCG